MRAKQKKNKEGIWLRNDIYIDKVLGITQI